MKTVVLNEDVNSRFKYQTLVQDYVELQQETAAARNNVMALKQKELTLQAEVRFLRRRRNFLLKNKSSTLQEQVFVKRKPTQFRKNDKKKVHFEKQLPSRKLPPAEKTKAPKRKSSPEFDLIPGTSLHGVTQQSVQRVIANQRVRVNGPKVSPFLDSSLQDDLFRNQEPVGQSQSRKPVIDLNRISGEEEELQERRDLFDHPTDSLIRNGLNEQNTNLQLSMFRNVGSGTSGRAGKRKVSWQDPVALRV